MHITERWSCMAHEHIAEGWFINGRAYKDLYMGFQVNRYTKIMYFGHAHEHIITGRWFIYGRAYENPYTEYLINTLIGTRKLCILQDVGSYMGVFLRIPIWGFS